MARKVFISVLGTGFYDACKYVKGGFVSSETRFIQQATLEYLKVCNNWTTKNANGEVIDRIYILLTDGAREKNWNKAISSRTNFKNGQEEPYLGLEQVLIGMNLPCPVETLEIPDGKNEEEMWVIFNTVYEALKPSDELYFDLTHSYRYLPMLVLVLGNYAKFLKNVKVKHISYGNYEARDTVTNEAPLMDILPLTMLQDWTFAAADLIQNGNITKLQELKDANALTPMLRTRGKNNKDKRITDESLTNYVDSLHAFLLDMKLCLGPNVLSGININRIKSCYEQVMDVYGDVIAPIPPIFEKIEQSLREFEETDAISLQNGYEAAKWCYYHQLYQQACTILDENITTHFCKLLGTDEHDINHRKASNAFLRWGEYRDNDWNDACFDSIRESVKLAETNPEIQDFIRLMRWDVIWIHNDCRNKYNHASMIQGSEGMLSSEDIEKLGKIIRKITARVR
ncbi:MAG: TIGR02221 family CRISPR-associated protein [Prevotella sp.]|nr:TIGR02221 family CRISPR-associated protein [Prevotella sp.]